VGGILNVILARRLGSEILRELIKAYVNRRGYKAFYNYISFKQEQGITQAEIDKLSRISRALLARGVNAYTFRTYTESVPIISREKEVRVLSNARSVKISELGDSIIKSLPRYMEIVRIYALPALEETIKDLV
jgi:hypothetical protein